MRYGGYISDFVHFRIKDGSHRKGKIAKSHSYMYVGSSQRYVDYRGISYNLQEPAVGDKYIELEKPNLHIRIDVPKLGSCVITQDEISGMVESLEATIRYLNRYRKQ